MILEKSERSRKDKALNFYMEPHHFMNRLYDRVSAIARGGTQ